MSIKLMLVDAHGIVRAGLRNLLEAEPDMVVVAGATSSERALERMGDCAPDVVIVGVSLPGMDSPAAIRRLRIGLSATPILALMFRVDDREFFRMLDAGATGFVPMSASPAELVIAIRVVHQGEVYLHPSQATTLVDGYLQRARIDRDAPQSHTILTPRQRQILSLVAEGLSNVKIAQRLRISAKTVARHRENIRARLDLHSHSALVKYAMRTGLTEI